MYVHARPRVDSEIIVIGRGSNGYAPEALCRRHLSARALICTVQHPPSDYTNCANARHLLVLATRVQRGIPIMGQILGFYPRL